MQSIRATPVVLRDAWQDFQFVERSGQLNSPFVFGGSRFLSRNPRLENFPPRKGAATAGASRSPRE